MPLTNPSPADAACCDPESDIITDVKAWIDRQEAIHPFGVGLPMPERVAFELQESGFERVTLSQIGEHPVYVFKGRTGSSRCNNYEDMRRTLVRLARMLGFKFRAADSAISCSRGRFQVTLLLETPGSPDNWTRIAAEILAGGDHDEQFDQGEG